MTASFHGIGMNLVAMTTLARAEGSSGQQAADDALALAASVDLGGVEQGDARFDAGFHASRIVASLYELSYPPMPQVPLSPQAQVPTPRGGTVTSEPASVMRSPACGTATSVTGGEVTFGG